MNKTIKFLTLFACSFSLLCGCEKSDTPTAVAKKLDKNLNTLVFILTFFLNCDIIFPHS